MAAGSAVGRDVEQILGTVWAYASRRARPVLVMLTGLPGSGKSRVAEELRSRTSAVVLESDDLRRLLFHRPVHSADESRRLFAALHAAAEALLAEGASVVVDATNVVEAERAPLYALGERTGAKLIVVQVTAPDRVIRRRLGVRARAGTSRSEADTRVYERMQFRLEPIQRPHLVVDTSQETGPALATIVKEISGDE